MVNTLLTISSLGYHSGDEENVDIILKHDETESSGFKLVGALLFGHGEKTFYSADELNLINKTHAELYIAKNTHATYKEPVWLNLSFDTADGAGETFAPTMENIKNTAIEFRAQNAPESLISGRVGTSVFSPSTLYGRKADYDDIKDVIIEGKKIDIQPSYSLQPPYEEDYCLINVFNSSEIYCNTTETFWCQP